MARRATRRPDMKPPPALPRVGAATDHMDVYRDECKDTYGSGKAWGLSNIRGRLHNIRRGLQGTDRRRGKPIGDAGTAVSR
jgi:hypothetical protein